MARSERAKKRAQGEIELAEARKEIDKIERRIAKLKDPVAVAKANQDLTAAKAKRADAWKKIRPKRSSSKRKRKGGFIDALLGG